MHSNLSMKKIWAIDNFQWKPTDCKKHFRANYTFETRNTNHQFGTRIARNWQFRAFGQKCWRFGGKWVRYRADECSQDKVSHWRKSQPFSEAGGAGEPGMNGWQRQDRAEILVQPKSISSSTLSVFLRFMLNKRMHSNMRPARTMQTYCKWLKFLWVSAETFPVF